MRNFVKIAEGMCPFKANLYQKLQILMILRYFSSHFYTYNVEIRLTEADLEIPQPHKIS